MAKTASSSQVGASVPNNFENALQELESIVNTMEKGDIPLDDALNAYQRGTILLKFCQDKLTSAEQTLKMLENGELTNAAEIESTE